MRQDPLDRSPHTNAVAEERVTAVQSRKRGPNNPGRRNPLYDIDAEFVFEQVPLAPYTSFRVGGPADILVGVRQIDQLVAVLEATGRSQEPVYVFGRGSNLLFSDKGRRGIVVRNESSAIDERPDGVIAVDSGVRLPALAIETARKGLTGLEWVVGIPGTVGGAVAMNAGAQGICVADILMKAVVFDRRSICEIAAPDLEYSYRSSRLRRQREKIVLQAWFQLQPADPVECLKLIEEYRRRRKATQPTDPGAGSIFKNPEGEFAGRLIEAAGLKGERVGNALVSPKHANFIINTGNATAADVRALMQVIQEHVMNRFDIWLEPEIELVDPGLAGADE